MYSIKCIGCGIEKECEVDNLSDYNKQGFIPIWDISNGLKTIVLCYNCANKVKPHVQAIQDIIKRDIDLVNFGDEFNKIEKR